MQGEKLSFAEYMKLWYEVAVPSEEEAALIAADPDNFELINEIFSRHHAEFMKKIEGRV